MSFVLSKTKFSEGNSSKEIMEQWKKQIFDKDQYGETFIRFIITLIITAGAIIKLIYNSYGMAALPLFLIKGTRSLEDEKDAVGKSIEYVREQLRTIQEKYQRSHKQVSRKDKIMLNKLRKEEKMLN
jgi:hypothetical protein